MLLPRRVQTLALWMALMAVFVAALAPTLARAANAQGAAGWVEVCSAQGSRWVDGTAGVTGPGDAGFLQPLLDHCPYCSLQLDQSSLPPAAQAQVPLSAAAFALPAAFLAAGHTLHAWQSAQARAPPQQA